MSNVMEKDPACSAFLEAAVATAKAAGRSAQRVGAQYKAEIGAAVVGGLVALSGSAHAAIDITTATTGIADATTAVVGVIGAMITMSATVFGLKKVLHLLGGR